MHVWNFLHIVPMFGAVTLLIGGSLALALAFRRSDPTIIRSVGHAVHPLENAGIVLFIVGVVFGLITAAAGGFDFFDGWLIAAFVMIGVLLVLGPIESVLANRVIKAAEASGDTASPELAALSLTGASWS